jgi:hypothetical protein
MDNSKQEVAAYLTLEQVEQLNDKYGWFEFGDAQSDKSRAFAQDAIAMHERLRATAPELLAALKAEHRAADWLLARLIELDPSFRPTQSPVWAAIAEGSAAIAKATGKQA